MQLSFLWGRIEAAIEIEWERERARQSGSFFLFSLFLFSLFPLFSFSLFIEIEWERRERGLDRVAG